MLPQIEIQKFMKNHSKLRLGISSNMRAAPETRFWWSRYLSINKFQKCLRLQNTKFIKISFMVLSQIEIQKSIKNHSKLSLGISLNMRAGLETRFWWSRNLKKEQLSEIFNIMKNQIYQNFIHGVTSNINSEIYRK